eukprot:m.978405 g.978405  ORF g.978405 m.978405 type:complete len:991 (+) comp23957_c0_seq1:104-3076(+)
MSRLIVKNIPKRITENRLRETFTPHGEVTQVKILPKRRFAYVGYLSEKSARAAQKYLDGTYIDTSKIEVALALTYGDANIPRAWSKYSSGSSAFAAKNAAKNEGAGSKRGSALEQARRQKHTEVTIKEGEEAAAKIRLEREKELLAKVYKLKGGQATDAELQEYWNVAGTGASSGRTWMNDDVTGQAQAPLPQSDPSKKATATAKFEKVEGKVYGSRGMPMVRSHVTFDDSDDDYQEMNTDAGPAAPDADNASVSDAEEDEDMGNVAKNTTMSDMDYLRSKMKGRATQDSDADSDDDADNNSAQNAESDSDGGAAQAAAVVGKRKRVKRGKSSAASDAAGSASTDESSRAAAPTTIPSEGAGMNTVRLRGLPFSATEQTIKDFFHPLTPLEIRLTKDRKDRPSGRAFVDFAPPEVQKALQYHKDHIDDRFIEVTLDDPEDHKDHKNKDKEIVKPPRKFPELSAEDNTLGETGRLFVRNLSYLCTENDLEDLMSKFGPISEVHLPVDKETKKSKAIAFVTFLMPEHAVAAYQALDGQIFQGRLLHLLPSKEKRDHTGLSEEVYSTDKNEKYKKKSLLKKKAESGNAFNWNTLFMRSDTVVDAMASSYGVDKAAVLDKDSKGSMAVRLALGETHIVAENKLFLQSEGVRLDAFDTRANGRSKTTILVKNTPFDTQPEDLRTLFGKFGGVGRVILPPSKTMALVEMLEPSEAKTAFRALAYRKFKHVPLYLEWAPEGCLRERTDDESPSVATNDDGAAAVLPDEESKDDDSSSAPTTTVFVKNLNFATTEDDFRAFFERCVAIRSARIATKKDPKHSGQVLSMGFGFVEFNSMEDAKLAMKQLQHGELDGHKLELKISSKAESASRKRTERGRTVKAGGTKLLVRNLPFEASKKEVKELCQAFGQIKSIRLPKKFDGAHRGFAFVDFLTKKEALSAFEALSLSTHLYGRRLVIEWAQDDESVATLQRKTDAAFGSGEGATSRKRFKLDETLGL